MRYLLEAAGHAVLEAPDARSALEIAANHRVDLAILDLVLPDRSGVDLARDLRNMPGGDVLPLIAVSAHFGPLDEARLSPHGFSEFLHKPVDAEALLRTVGSLVVGPSPSPGGAGEHRRVLVVDDDPVLRRLTALRLELLGFETETASDGRAALEAARQRPPDVIASDVLMPVLDGFGLCQAIRREPGLASVPIVLVSSHYLEPEDEALALRAGATRYITRSSGHDQVTESVLDVLANPGTQLDADDASAAADDLARAHAARISRQLERQTRLNQALRERVALQQ